MQLRPPFSRLVDSSVGINFLFCLGLAVSTPTQGQTPADAQEAARQAEILQRQNQERIQRDIESAVPAERAPSGVDTNRLLPKIDASGVGRKCHDIHEIVITGSPNLSRSVREDILARFTGKCLGVNEIEQILGEVTKDYISRGYITTRAYLPQQDLSSGKLEITVLEGVIEKIMLEDGGRNSIRLHNVFPSQGELFNLRDFEQGIDQVNKLSSNDARLDIQPGDKPGASKIVIKNTPKRPIHASLSADNQGSEGTGKNQIGVTVLGDRLLGMNELLLFTHRQSQPNDKQRKFSDSDSFSLILPLRYSTFSASMNRSRYVSTLRAPSGLDLQVKGHNATDTLKLERVMYRDQSTRYTVAGTITVKDAKNYLAEQYLGVSSRKLSVFDLDSSVVTGFLGGVFTFDLGYAQGLNFAGALNDPDDLPDIAPRAQFQKFKVGLGYHIPFQLAGTNWAFSTQFTGQHAKNTLYGSEQILIGGIYSVRGFLKNTLSGDHGYYVRNELSVLPTLPVAGGKLPVRMFAAIDFGEVRNRIPNVPSGKLTGGAVGISTNWKGAGIEVFNARPISMPDFFTRESSQTWLRLNFAV